MGLGFKPCPQKWFEICPEILWYWLPTLDPNYSPFSIGWNKEKSRCDRVWLERLGYKKQPSSLSSLSPELLTLRETSCLCTCRWSIERPTQWGRGPPANSLRVLPHRNGPSSSCLVLRWPQSWLVIQAQTHETLWVSITKLSHSWSLDPQKLSDNKCLYF